jgi:hypothetical protein
MIHEAQCHMVLAPNVGAKPTRVVEAQARLELKAELPVSPEALGGKEIRLIVKGENAAMLFALLTALKDPNADVEGLVKQLRGLNEGSDPTPDHGPHGGGTA